MTNPRIIPDPREVVGSNAFVGRGSISHDPADGFSVGMTNWSMPGSPAIVGTLNPQQQAGSPTTESEHETVRRARRVLLRELTSEFAALHDDLLFKLAR